MNENEENLLSFGYDGKVGNMRETSVRLLILFSDLHVKHAIIH